ncbi:MAG: hypothetical protein IBJ11_01405 [Phycisphaerales bacterium]|nr:hypothetical protein [Phycisphaerales bacterium]
MTTALPYTDWQFWAVTAAAAAAGVWLLRGIIPIPWLSRRRRQSRQSHKATLTLGGRPVGRK